jgi:glycosyltransferase involved in cell wall biosynthesis
MSSAERTITVLDARIVTGAGGGPEKTILNSPRFLEGTRYRNLALYLHAPGDPGIEVIRARAAQKRCPLITIADPRAVDFRTLATVAELCREHDVRIWHGHDYKSNLFGVLLARLCGLRLVTTVHGWVKHTEKTPLYFAVDRFALRRYEQVIAVSQDLFDASLAAGVARERLSLVENAIDTEEFRRRAPARLSPLREGTRDRLVVGAVGRLSEEKGFDLLIAAVERLLDEGLPLELWIAGEGDREEALRAQIAASRHARHLSLLGYRTDTRELFEAFDVFALSSLREGLPNVVLEAMSMEVPVVATRCGGMQAFAREGEDALLVETGSLEALRAGIGELVADPARRERLATAARERVERELGFARRIERIAKVYDRLLETPGRA